jgi:high-affinity nickel-transport protein
MRHATDPDHVIAVTTILSTERRFAAAARVGAIWGLGHTVTVLIVGSAIIIFKIAIPVRLGAAMEFTVAIVLILLGWSTLSGRRHPRRGDAPHDAPGDKPDPSQPLTVHRHSHRHGLMTHSHSHAHQPDLGDPNVRHNVSHKTHLIETDHQQSRHHRRRIWRSFLVGLAHGTAGSAAIALLVLSAIPTPQWAMLYLLVFCLGTIVGMSLLTIMIAVPFIASAQRLMRLHEYLITGAGAASLAFGLFLGYRIGFVDHLFAANPIWIPR